MTLYSQFGDLENAVSVFNSTPRPSTLLWNLILKSHVDLGLPASALVLYKKMREIGVEHDTFTFPIVNRAVLSLGVGAVTGEMVHCVAIKLGFWRDVYFCNTLIEVYVRSGLVSYARKVFDTTSHRDVVTWTSMISGYASEPCMVKTFGLYKEMQVEVEPNAVTMMVMLQTCSAAGRLSEGMQLHGCVIKNGLLDEVSVQNSVLSLYTTMGSREEVEIFSGDIRHRDVVSWNILLSYFFSMGDTATLVESFRKMRTEVPLGLETLTLVISSVSKRGDLAQCEMLHCFALKTGLQDSVLFTSLLGFYATCGQLKTAIQLFVTIPYKSNITWAAMMSGFIRNGHFQEAISFFRNMLAVDRKPEVEVLKTLVDVCTHLGALRLGKTIHGYLIRNLFQRSLEENITLETTILNMYAKCGDISAARACFDNISVKDIVTWTSMIEGYGSHGLGYNALELFNLMEGEGIAPNSVTFLSLLSACSHSGLVKQGYKVLYSMKWMYGMEPDLDHYTCVVDLLGRAGKLKEALLIIVKMVAFPDSRIWGALLSASRTYGDRNLAEYAAQRLFELEPDNVGYYTILSNVQASVGQWSEVQDIRRAVDEKELKKKPGWSCFEEKGQIHGFVSGDRSHHRVDDIYEILGYLNKKIQEFGFV